MEPKRGRPPGEYDSWVADLHYQEIYQMYKQGLSVAQIANRVGKHKSVVLRGLKKRGYRLRTSKEGQKIWYNG